MGGLVNLRLGVLGLSPGNGHPFSFSAIVNGYDDDAFSRAGQPAIHAYLRERKPEEFGIEGVRVSCAWTPNPNVTRHLCASCRIDEMLDRPEDMLGRVDAALLLRDDPESHFVLGLPFLEADIPLFIDKPLTLKKDELARFEPYLRSGKLMSCAGLRYATELDALRSDRKFLGELKLIRGVVLNNWHAYGIHLLDAVLGLGFPPPVHIQRLASPHDSLAVSLADGTLFTIDALHQAPKIFSLVFFGSDGTFAVDMKDNFGAFQRVLTAFIEQVRSGKPAIEPEETLTSIRTIVAGLESRPGDPPRAIDRS